MKGLGSGRVAALVGAVIMLALSAPARGEITASPWVGVAFGGNLDEGQLTYGVCLGLRGDRSVFGFEVDFGLAPEFFPEVKISDSSVTTLMGNLVITAPRRGSRLYASAGIGILRTRVQDVRQLFQLDRNDFGLNVGGGLIAFIGSRVGLRAEIRYFRALTGPEPAHEFDVELGDLDFWRATAAVVVRF